jgi:hypothetical protein
MASDDDEGGRSRFVCSLRVVQQLERPIRLLPRRALTVPPDADDIAMTLQPLQFVPAVLSGWLNEHQAHVVDYLREENRLLRQRLRGPRLRLTDDDRRRLAAKGILLGRKLLAQAATIVTPETILAWHRNRKGCVTCSRTRMCLSRNLGGGSWRRCTLGKSPR